MVLESQIFDYIDGDGTPFEREPMNRLVVEEQLIGYVHKGFWQCMDTLREKEKLDKLWELGDAPWKIWEN
jgi:glucose-1-phosphate cytidylyltransferase